MPKYRLFTILLCFLAHLGAVSGASIVEVNNASDIQRLSSERTLILVLSLSCDLGEILGDAFLGSLSDLEGPYIGVCDINKFPNSISNNMGIYLKGIIIVQNNRVVASNAKDEYGIYSNVSGNQANRLWIKRKLDDLGVPHSMTITSISRAKPSDLSLSSIDLAKNSIAWYDFEPIRGKPESRVNQIERTRKDLIDNKFYFAGQMSLGNYLFNPSGGLSTGEYTLDGLYTTGRRGMRISSTEILTVAKNPFSFSLNVRLDSKIAEKVQTGIFVAVGSGKLVLKRLYAGKNAGKLLISLDSRVYEKSLPDYPGIADVKSAQLKYWKDGYIVEDLDFALDVWHHLAFALDYQSRRIKVQIDGKRYDDFIITEQMMALLPRPAYLRDGPTLMEFGSEARGDLLYGSADDITYYDRVLNGSELRALYDRDKKTPTPKLSVAKSTPSINAGQKPLAWNGLWETTWGSSDEKTTKLTLEVSGSKVLGTYEHEGGSLQGVISNVNGSMVLQGMWTQVDGKKGWFKFVMDEAGAAFKGTWGYDGQALTNQGWNGYRSVAGFGLD